MKKATSLQRSLSSEIESNPIAKLDQFNVLPLSFGSGLETLYSSATMTVIRGFFVPLIQFLIGRGGAFSIQDPLWERLARRLTVTVSNTLTVLESSHLERNTGAHLHA